MAISDARFSITEATFIWRVIIFVRSADGAGRKPDVVENKKVRSLSVHPRQDLCQFGTPVGVLSVGFGFLFGCMRRG